MEAKELTKLAVKALEDKKGEDIRVIDIHGVSVLADYFVIADGSNASQVKAMADNVEDETIPEDDNLVSSADSAEEDGDDGKED